MSDIGSEEMEEEQGPYLGVSLVFFIISAIAEERVTICFLLF